jgi:hypothetical protein
MKVNLAKSEAILVRGRLAEARRENGRRKTQSERMKTK